MVNKFVSSSFTLKRKETAFFVRNLQEQNDDWALLYSDPKPSINPRDMINDGWFNVTTRRKSSIRNFALVTFLCLHTELLFCHSGWNRSYIWLHAHYDNEQSGSKDHLKKKHSGTLRGWDESDHSCTSENQLFKLRLIRASFQWSVKALKIKLDQKT